MQLIPPNGSQGIDCREELDCCWNQADLRGREEMRTSDSGSLKCSKNILIYMSDTQSKNESHKVPTE